MKDLKFSIYCVCLLLTFFVFTACKKDKEPSTANHLSFKIDGVYWESDKGEVFGSYHLSEAIGPKLINITGAKGSGATQQTFNINLFNTDVAGLYSVNIPIGATAGINENVAQFSNLTSTNYLCGGTLQGSQFNINVTKVSKSPQIVEATFSGFMECVDGNTIVISEGKFIYHE